MASTFGDLIYVGVSSAPGTGSTIGLGSTVSGFRPFTDLTNGVQVSYAIDDGSNREVGRATYSSAGPSLTGRTPVVSSAGVGTVINASATARVAVTILAEDLSDISSAINAKLSKSGDTMTGNLTFSADNAGLIFSQGGKIFEQATGGTSNAGRTVVEAANDSFEILKKDGSASIWSARYADAAPTFKGNAVWHATNLPLTAAQAANLAKMPDAGPLAGMRNRIINGNFVYWQRNSNSGSWIAPVTNYYQADRWVSNIDGTGGAGAWSMQIHTLGELDSILGFTTVAFSRHSVTSAPTGQTTNNCWVEQRIESVRTFANGQVTVSGAIRCDTARTILCQVYQSFGTGGSPSAGVSMTSQNINATSGWTKFSLTFTVPSIAGKTLGSNSNDYFGVRFYLPTNTTYTLDLSCIQAESGSVSTPFEQRNLWQEVALCQRYYQTLRGTLFMSGAVAGGFYTTGIVFPTAMRTTPTLTTNPDGTVTNASAAQFDTATNNACRYYIQATNAGNSGVEGRTGTANAEL